MKLHSDLFEWDNILTVISSSFLREYEIKTALFD